MSHTTEAHGVTFIHNGDYSGDIWIRLPEAAVEPLTGLAGEEPHVRVTVPFAALKAFVAGYVRDEKIRALEQAEDDELLGVKP